MHTGGGGKYVNARGSLHWGTIFLESGYFDVDSILISKTILP